MNPNTNPTDPAPPGSDPDAVASPEPKTDNPRSELSLSVPTEWLDQLEAIATTTQRPLAEVGREAIARYLAITVSEATEIARLRGDLNALKQQLGRLDAVEAILARLSRRQEALERSPQPSQSPANMAAAPATAPSASPAPSGNSDEDWGLFDDEPDEVLTDFLQ